MWKVIVIPMVVGNWQDVTGTRFYLVAVPYSVSVSTMFPVLEVPAPDATQAIDMAAGWLELSPAGTI